jgi:hypothetical protein
LEGFLLVLASRRSMPEDDREPHAPRDILTQCCNAAEASENVGRGAPA